MGIEGNRQESRVKNRNRNEIETRRLAETIFNYLAAFGLDSFQFRFLDLQFFNLLKLTFWAPAPPTLFTVGLASKQEGEGGILGQK